MKWRFDKKLAEFMHVKNCASSVSIKPYSATITIQQHARICYRHLEWTVCKRASEST
jgi:hypothetical protein